MGLWKNYTSSNFCTVSVLYIFETVSVLFLYFSTTFLAVEICTFNELPLPLLSF